MKKRAACGVCVTRARMCDARLESSARCDEEMKTDGEEPRVVSCFAFAFRGIAQQTHRQSRGRLRAGNPPSLREFPHPGTAGYLPSMLRLPLR